MLLLLTASAAAAVPTVRSLLGAEWALQIRDSVWRTAYMLMYRRVDASHNIHAVPDALIPTRTRERIRDDEAERLRIAAIIHVTLTCVQPPIA